LGKKWVPSGRSSREGDPPRNARSTSTSTRSTPEKERYTGTPAVYGAESGDLGGFRKRIAPGAFAPAFDGADVRRMDGEVR